MKNQLRFWIVVVTFLLSLPIASISVAAESYSGQIVGIDCAEGGQLCPVEAFEEHISNEPEFVLLDASKNFYLLSNISRDTLVRYVSNRVIVSGLFDETSNTIRVTELRVLRGDALSQYESVWQSPN